MPAYVSFTRKGESVPTDLVKIDEELCGVLGVEVHPVKWVNHWDVTIQFGIAIGNPVEAIRECFADDENVIKMLDYLEEHYVFNAWR